MLFIRFVVVAALLHLASPTIDARTLRRSRSPGRTSTITLHRRLHVNTLITEPGSAEVEWNNAFSLGGNYSMPSTVKFTPKGSHILWGRTEFSAGFDALSSVREGDHRVTHFSDRMTFGANCVIVDGERLDIAIAPQVSFFLRDGGGARLGATGIARYDWGRNSAGMTLTWTGATTSSATNPAGSFNLGVRYGRRLAASGFLGRFSAHINLVSEQSTGVDRLVSAFEGVECQLSEKVALDVSTQHWSVVGGIVDHQIVAGLTVNLGRPRRWFH